MNEIPGLVVSDDRLDFTTASSVMARLDWLMDEHGMDTELEWEAIGTLMELFHRVGPWLHEELPDPGDYPGDDSDPLTVSGEICQILDGVEATGSGVQLLLMVLAAQHLRDLWLGRSWWP